MSLHCEKKQKCSRCKKSYKLSAYGINKKGTPYRTCRKCRYSRETMQEPTITLTWEQLLVRGEIKTGYKAYGQKI